MMAQRYPQLGGQITRLVRSLVATKGWSMGFTMDYVGRRTNYGPDTVHRWRQGRLCPPPQVIETLAQIGHEEANLDRTWGERLLRAAYYPSAMTALNNIWGLKETHPIPCNLPPLTYTELIGRQAELARLLELLTPRYAAPIITVDGIGGVGKTALVLEIAYRCWKASVGEIIDPHVPTFEAIIFFTAKQQYLTPGGILFSAEARRTLHDIFGQAAHTLNRFEITRVAPSDQQTKVREALAQQRTLLIIDNLETMEERHEIITFLYELPPSVKIVITTREREVSFSPIRLQELPEKEALRLIEKQAQEQEVIVSNEQALVLYQRVGGIPAALAYAIGQIASGYSMERGIYEVRKPTGDVARFCFQESVEPLRGRDAHSLLMAIAMFPKPPLRPALAHTAGLATDTIAVEDGLAQLRKLSLVSQKEGGRYGMLPLTREYALAELAAHSEFELQARERWVKWYLDFAKEYAGDDWNEWHIAYDQVENEWENLLAVFDWCATNEQYDMIKTFWRLESIGESQGSVLEFAYIYGYWDERLTWLPWLVKAAERRGDWVTAIQAMSETGFTLTLMGRLKEAERYLKQAWDHQEQADLEGQINLAKNSAILCLYQKYYERAWTWLDQCRKLTEEAQFGEREYIRRWIDPQIYYGSICYGQGNYDQAETHFRTVRELAQAIGWLRLATNALNWLADVAIAQGRFAEAEDLLKTGLPVAERNKNARRIALFQSSFAHLYEKQGNLDEACRWAGKAFDGFERLGMLQEIWEMGTLLERCRLTSSLASTEL